MSAPRPVVPPRGDLLILTQSEVRNLIDPTTLIDALEAAFVQLSSGRAVVPPRSAAVNSSGDFLGTMPGFLGDTLAAKLVSIYPRNPAVGLPSIQAVVVLFDSSTGSPIALLDGTYLTAIRTGASTAVAVRLLARMNASVLAIIGAGVQGRSHLATVPSVRTFTEIRIASRNLDHARRLQADFPHAKVVSTFEEAVAGADVVCGCTDSPVPILAKEWISPGALVTSVGFSSGPELPADLIQSSHVFVESRDALKPFPAGAHELQHVDPIYATELGEALSDPARGRRFYEELIVYKSVGHAVEDAAAARAVYEAARSAKVGVSIKLT